MKNLMKSILDSIHGIVQNVDDTTTINFNKTEHTEKEFLSSNPKVKKTIITIEIIEKI